MGAAMRRENVRMLGIVYMFSCGVSLVRTLRSGFFLGAGFGLLNKGIPLAFPAELSRFYSIFGYIII